MDFRRYVREHLPPLTIAREAEIVEELAQHLDDIYREARDAGLDHSASILRTRSEARSSILTSRDRAVRYVFSGSWYGARYVRLRSLSASSSPTNRSDVPSSFTDRPTR
jgi:hypothetical protein